MENMKEKFRQKIQHMIVICEKDTTVNKEIIFLKFSEVKI